MLVKNMNEEDQRKWENKMRFKVVKKVILCNKNSKLYKNN